MSAADLPSFRATAARQESTPAGRSALPLGEPWAEVEQLAFDLDFEPLTGAVASNDDVSRGGADVIPALPAALSAGDVGVVGQSRPDPAGPVAAESPPGRPGSALPDH
jgi:hypothetical protein